MANSPKIVAHRGLHIEHPENSLPAFAAALDAGIDWLETDVHLSADGEVIIMHDETLERTSAGSGPLAAMKARELTKLRLKTAGGQITDASIPLLADMIDQFGQRAGLLVEIKPYDAKTLVRRVYEMLKPLPRWIIQGFDPRNVQHAREAGAGDNIAVLTGKPESLAAAVEADWPAVHVQHKLLAARIVQRLRDRGASIGAWTVNDRIEMQRVLDLGVDQVTSDDPVTFRNVRDKR